MPDVIPVPSVWYFMGGCISTHLRWGSVHQFFPVGWPTFTPDFNLIVKYWMVSQPAYAPDSI